MPYSAVEQDGPGLSGWPRCAAKPLVVDVSNPSAARDGDALAKWVDEQGGAGLATAELLPGAHIVRAFNALGHNGLHGADVLTKRIRRKRLACPSRATIAQAMALATKLFKETRFEPVLIGGLAKGKYLVSGRSLAASTRRTSFARLQKA